MTQNELETALVGRSIREAARSIGVGYSTFKYWMHRHGLTSASNPRARKPWGRLSFITTDQLKAAVLNNFSYSGAIRELGLSTRGNSFTSVKCRIQNEGITTEHFKRIAHGRIPDSKFFVYGKIRSTSALRCRYLKLEIEYSCVECHNKGIWNEKALSLQLDHKNGDLRDNRLTNLRWLCPNCHTQTNTFAGKRRPATDVDVAQR